MSKRKPQPTPKKLRILDVGASPDTSLGKVMFPDEDVFTLNVPEAEADFHFDLESQEFLDWKVQPFDNIVMSHVLEHLDIQKVPNILNKLWKLVRYYDHATEQGQVLIKVPSMEWAAKEIVNEKANPVVMFHIYGAQFNQFQIHRWGYTMPSLRAFMRGAGFTEFQAGVSQYQIYLGDQPFPAIENVVIGIKLQNGHKR